MACRNVCLYVCWSGRLATGKGWPVGRQEPLDATPHRVGRLTNKEILLAKLVLLTCAACLLSTAGCR